MGSRRHRFVRVDDDHNTEDGVKGRVTAGRHCLCRSTRARLFAIFLVR
jgi:hypothetical protein